MHKKNGMFCALMLFLYITGTASGIGYAAYIGQWPTVIGVSALAYMAWPKAKEYFKTLLNP